MRKRSLQPTRVTPDPRPRQKQENRCSGVPIIQTRLRKVPPPGTLPGRIRPAARPRSMALSTPTRSPRACGRSWRSAAPGPGPPPTFCVLAPTAGLVGHRGTEPAGPKIRARSPGACAARKPSCGHWASTSRSAVEAARAAGSSGCVRIRKYRLHRQHRPRPPPPSSERPTPRANDVCEDSCWPDLTVPRSGPTLLIRNPG